MSNKIKKVNINGVEYEVGGGGSAITVVDQLPENPDETAIYKVKKEGIVPNTGYLESIKFNTDLSIDEVLEIASSLTAQDALGFTGTVILYSGNIDVDTNSKLIIFAEEEGVWMLGDFLTTEVYWDSIEGWGTFDNPVPIQNNLNQALVIYGNTLLVGEENYKLTKLFRSEPPIVQTQIGLYDGYFKEFAYKSDLPQTITLSIPESEITVNTELDSITPKNPVLWFSKNIFKQVSDLLNVYRNCDFVITHQNYTNGLKKNITHKIVSYENNQYSKEIADAFGYDIYLNAFFGGYQQIPAHESTTDEYSIVIPNPTYVRMHTLLHKDYMGYLAVAISESLYRTLFRSESSSSISTLAEGLTFKFIFY